MVVKSSMTASASMWLKLCWIGRFGLRESCMGDRLESHGTDRYGRMISYLGAEECISGVVAFQPTVLKGLGYKSSAAQVHSIPIYCVAFVTSLTCAWLSERLRQRYFFALFGGLLTVLGVAIEIAQPPAAGARYAGMFFIVAGTYVTMPIIVVWSAINLGKGYKRTVAFGLVIATGNAGALISSNVFITSEAPTYRTGELQIQSLA